MKALPWVAVALLIVAAVAYRVLHGEQMLAQWATSSGRGAAQQPAGPRTGPLVGIDLEFIDDQVRPQDNLYLHVNGGWLAATQIPEDDSNYGAFTEVADEAEIALRAIIEELAASEPPPGTDARRIADMYASFMDEGRVEMLGLQPLQAEFEAIDAITSPGDVVAWFARAQRAGFGAPLALWVNQDLRESTRYTVYINQSGLGLPDRDYYFNEEPRFVKIRADYLAHVERLLALAGQPDAAKAAAEIVALESRLAGEHWERARNRDREATYNRYELAEADTLMPGFGWPAFLEAAALVNAEAVIIRQPDYFEALAALISEIPPQRWRSYLRWHLLRAASPYLPSAFVEADFDFYGRSLRGIEQNEPRWKRGVAAVERALGEALGRIYVERHFSSQAKASMDALVRNLREAFRLAIDELDWMSEPTRAEAQRKLERLTTKIGYPDHWRDYSALELRADTLLANVLDAREFEHARDAAKLGAPVDRDEWFLTPQTVNAYYNPPMNEIVFPAAILQPPFFDVNADSAVNYGAIGGVIGHEISHGFDDQGRKSDGDGNLRDWWQEADAQEFHRRARRLVAQYAAFNPVGEMHVNGELTLGENIADLAGLTVAYRAYRLSLQGREPPVIAGYTGDQRFFMGWAQVWRRKYRDDELRRRLLVDPHAPSEYRVLGVVANMPSFYAAFNVADGDGMYLQPADRVAIW